MDLDPFSPGSGSSSKNLHQKGRLGFTLVELLASMAVLVLLVLMLTKIYTESASALRVGKRSTERNINARAVMDYMARELAMAVYDFGSDPASNFLGMAYYANVTVDNFGLEGADEISFITLNKDLSGVPSPSSGDGGTNRSAYQVRYFVQNWDGLKDAPANAKYRFALWRDFYHPQAPASSSRPPGAYNNISNDESLKWMGSKQNPTFFQRRSMLIDNVRTFEVFVYTDPLGASVADWTSWSGQKIAFMDIYLETMDERDAAQAALLAESFNDPNHPTVVEFVEGAVKRNYRRVYLHNKYGYQDVAP